MSAALPVTLSASALLFSGVAGSVHCALMCGALSAQAARGAKALRGVLVLHAGRVTGYALLGAAAGALGGRLLGLLPSADDGRWLQAAAALLLIGIGLRQWQRIRKPLPACCVQSSERAAQRHTHPAMLYATGLAWTLTPCPFKYSMLMLASLAGTAASGALLMGAFALGSSPLMLLAGALLGMPVAGRRAAQCSAVAMAGIGIATLLALVWMPGASMWGWCVGQ